MSGFSLDEPMHMFFDNPFRAPTEEEVNLERQCMRKAMECSLETCSPCLPTCKKSEKCVPKKKEQDMYTTVVNNLETPTTDVARTQEYLNNRTYGIQNTKYHEAEKVFYMIDMPCPHTPAELVKRIQDGLFVLPEKKDAYYYNPTDVIVWRDPAKEADKEGYKAFEKVLAKRATETRDAIMVKSPEEALKAVQDFEALEIQ